MGDFWGLVHSDGLIQLPPGAPAVKAGTDVKVELWPSLWRSARP